MPSAEKVIVDLRTKIVTGELPSPEALRTLVNQIVSPAGTAVPLKFAVLLLVVLPGDAAQCEHGSCANRPRAGTATSKATTTPTSYDS